MPQLHVKKAVEIARAEIVTLFEDEEIANVGLEEVVHNPDTGRWMITIGFARPWEQDGPWVDSLMKTRHPRTFKMVTIDDGSSRVLRVTDRALLDLPEFE